MVTIWTTGIYIAIATVLVVTIIFLIGFPVLWIIQRKYIKEVKKLQELRKNTVDVVTKINQNWVDEIKSADAEDRGINITDMFGKYSEQIKLLEQHFRDTEERIKRSSGKGGWFGK